MYYAAFFVLVAATSIFSFLAFLASAKSNRRSEKSKDMALKLYIEVGQIRRENIALNAKVKELEKFASDRKAQEQRFYDGLDNIMNYDINTARKAAKNDGE